MARSKRPDGEWSSYKNKYTGTTMEAMKIESGGKCVYLADHPLYEGLVYISSDAVEKLYEEVD